LRALVAAFYMYLMTERTARWAWFGGSFIGVFVSRAMVRFYPAAAPIAFCATAAWFFGWLARDNLQFRKEVAEQRRCLAERKAAVRTAQDLALRAAREANRDPSASGPSA
jgi:hypothetical protein